MRSQERHQHVGRSSLQKGTTENPQRMKRHSVRGEMPFKAQKAAVPQPEINGSVEVRQRWSLGEEASVELACHAVNADSA